MNAKEKYFIHFYKFKEEHLLYEPSPCRDSHCTSSQFPLATTGREDERVNFEILLELECILFTQ